MASNLHHHCLCHSSAAAAAPPTPTVCYCCSPHPVSYHPPPPDPHSVPPCFHNPHEQPHGFSSSQTLHHHHHRRRLQPQCCPPQPFEQTGQRYIQELHYQQQAVDHQPVFSSLLRRISSLETSLRRRRSSSSQSLRDAAARTIQTHFRAFLVRRSKTLRQLKELASIKSTLNILKSSASDSDPRSVSLKSKHLLLKLDSIQGSDPMIRDGKKSISRELIKFMELIDGISVQIHDLSSRLVNNVKLGNANSKSRVHVLQDIERMDSIIRERLDSIINKHLEWRKSVENDVEFESPKNSGILQTRKGCLAKRHGGGVQSKVDKVVTFAEDGNVFRVPKRNLKPVSGNEAKGIDREVEVDANEELMEDLFRRVDDLGVVLKEVEVDEEAQLDDDVGGSQESSDAETETEPNYSSRKEGNLERRLENGSFAFSAPLPVKMEGRAGFVNRSKAVRFAD